MNSKSVKKSNKIVVENHLKDIYNFLIPKSCPFELIRIGGKNDGAYLIPNDLKDIDACFSPGVNNFKNFEDELTKLYEIKCHMCDFTSDLTSFKTSLIEGFQTFKKKWLDLEGVPDSISLEKWIEELSPDQNKDLILQMDIEGAEFRNLLATKDQIFKRFRIMIIELHGLRTFKNPDLQQNEGAKLLKKLDGTHFCVHVHPNNACGDFIDPDTKLNIPDVLEVTYLRKDRFLGDKSKYKKPQLPHPLDIDRNVIRNPPIHLNTNWLGSNIRSKDSEIKVLRDKLLFEKWEKERITIEHEETLKLYRLTILNFLKTSKISIEFDKEKLLNNKWKDLADQKNYFLSSRSRHNPPGNIVKGNPRFFFHTDFGRNQSITVDLGDIYKLNYLIIKNRTDACQDRARILFFVIHNKITYSKKKALPVVVTDRFLEPNGPNSITYLFGKNGRYVTIFSPIYTSLHFSSIKVL